MKVPVYLSQEDLAIMIGNLRKLKKVKFLKPVPSTLNLISITLSFQYLNTYANVNETTSLILDDLGTSLKNNDIVNKLIEK